MAEKQKVHRQLTIEEILSFFPHKAQRLAQEITNAGLHCVGCHAATYETLEAGMKGHGMNDSAIDRLVDRLNALLEEKDAEDDEIILTPEAAKEFLEILNEQEKKGWALRFAHKMEGCSGFKYVLDYSETPNPDDEVFESNGVKIHVQKKMAPYLKGSTIDYLHNGLDSGFKISNRKARSSCGCGSSHNY